MGWFNAGKTVGLGGQICSGTSPAFGLAGHVCFQVFALCLCRIYGGAGNSGVLLRTIGEDMVWPNSMEAQLHSENAGDIWNIGDFPMKVAADRTNGRHTRKEHATNEKPLGEWNRYRIVVDGGRLELWVNGLLQNVATDCKVVPGWIALQSEGAFIEFRNIRLKKFR